MKKQGNASESIQKEIRNFCIIAHIDHGKSTLADRFLDITSNTKSGWSQVLDTMDLEQERGITIKLTPVRMHWKWVEINLIDTPWHVDFQYEVSRSLAAVEWCVLLVDASQWIQAQTLSTLYMAMENELTIIPVLNKVDLPAAEPEKRAKELQKLLWVERDEIYSVSAKTGLNVESVLDAIIEKVPTPWFFKQVYPYRYFNTKLLWDTDKKQNLEIFEQWLDPKTTSRALIFDSVFDTYQWVVTYVKVVSWSIRPWETVVLPNSGSIVQPTEVWHFLPAHSKDDVLHQWQIWYVVTWQKSVRDAQVWDTLIWTQLSKSKIDFDMMKIEAVPWFKNVKPFVFAWVYPVESDEYEKLKVWFDKLSLNDSALQVWYESSLAMGQWFRCGFLWTLHMDIIKERLTREYGMETIFTTPTVTYLVKMKNHQDEKIQSWRNVKELIESGMYQAVLKHQWIEEKDISAILWTTHQWNKSTSEILQEYYAKELYPRLMIKSWSTMPEQGMIDEILEPMVNVEIVWPEEFSGNIMQLAQEYRGDMISMEYLDEQRLVWKYLLPMGEIIVDFYDTLKSTTKGYATMNYEFQGYMQNSMVRLDMYINEELMEAFSIVVHRDSAYEKGKKMTKKLKTLIPRHMFPVPIQAWIGGKIIARETIPAMKKDVTSKCYGWDITRKKKLLKKQKEGKKKLKQMGSVNVPGDVFIKMVGND